MSPFLLGGVYLFFSLFSAWNLQQRGIEGPHILLLHFASSGSLSPEEVPKTFLCTADQVLAKQKLLILEFHNVSNFLPAFHFFVLRKCFVGVEREHSQISCIINREYWWVIFSVFRIFNPIVVLRRKN